jgi:hypothetical protein
VPYSVLSDGETVANGSVEIEDLCGAMGTFSISRSCATPGSMTAAVTLSGAPAGEALDLFLIGDGFYFTEPGHKGNPGFHRIFTTSDGSYNGTLELTPEEPYIAAEQTAFDAELYVGAVDYNYAFVIEAQPVAVPACTTSTPPDNTPPDNTPPDNTPPDNTPPDNTPPGNTPPGNTPPGTTPTVVPGGAANANVAPGAQQTITVPGFQPGESVQVTLYSTPVDLGVHKADAQGVVRVTFTVPRDLELGSHRVELVGLSSGVVAEVPFQVTKAAGSPTSASLASTADTKALAYTGAEVFPLLGFGLLAVAAGAALVLTASRRTARR